MKCQGFPHLDRVAHGMEFRGTPYLIPKIMSPPHLHQDIYGVPLIALVVFAIA